MSEPWQCPRCGNRYRHTTQCPECSPPTLQQIGNHQLRPLRRFASVEEVTRPTKIAGIIGVSLMGLGFVADATSVLGTLFGQNTLLPRVLIFATGVALIGVWLKFFERNANLASTGRARSGADVYETAQDGSVTLHTVRAKCPVPHCDGHLDLVSPSPPNQEGIRRPLGICDVHGLPHAFEFNLGSLKGNRVTVRPREEPPPHRS